MNKKVTFMRKLIVLLLMIPQSLLAADAVPEQVLVTGSFSRVSPAQMPSFVTVIDEQAIRALDKRKVSDVLKTVPGVLVEEQGGPGGLTAVSIRGGESNFTLVLIDGVQVNDPLNSRGGSFDFGKLDINSVERIEIVRGPQSAIYGSDALAGVINIITRAPTEQAQQRLTAQWGEKDYETYHASASGKLAALGYSLQVGHRDAGEPIAGSTNKSDQFAIALALPLGEQHDVNLRYNYLDGQSSSYPEQSGGPDFALLDELDNTQYNDRTLALAWEYRIVDYWQSRVAVSWLQLKEDFVSPGIVPFSEVPPYDSDSDYQRTQWQWVNTIGAGGDYWMNLGADYKREDGKSEGMLAAVLPTDFDLDRDISGVFLDLHGQLSRDLLVQASVRYDNPDDSRSESTPKLGARYQANESLVLRGNWGQGYKLPSFFALGHGLVGNPDLKPETATSWDVGGEWQPVAALTMELSYFNNDYRDLIDFDPETFTNVNRSRVKTNGVEWMLDWQLTDNLQVASHATYTDIDVENEQSKLTGRPAWQAGMLVNWQINRQWQAVADYQWTDERYATSLYTGSSVTETLDDYFQLDFSLQWQVLDAVRIQLAIDNVFDENYEASVGFPAAGRLFRAGFTITR